MPLPDRAPARRLQEHTVTVRQRWTMVAAVLGSGIVFLDGTVVNVALKKIGEDLPASIVGVLEGQTYVTSGYLATLAALLILAGALADFFGRRRIFTIGLAGFGATSVLCGIAPNLELLVVFRILQGAAGALLVPGSLSIITATFEGAARSRAFGIWASATSATTILGPIVGGFLVDSISWRVAFLINLPLVVIALFATARYMEESRDESASGRFDWLGATVIAVAVGGLAFGAIRGQEKQWADPIAFVAIGIGLVATVAFPILMARSRNPLVPLSLFRSRGFAVINLSTLLIYGALYVSLGFEGLFLQGTLGYTAFAAGIIGLPVGLMLTFLSTRVGSIAGRIGARPFLTAGPFIMALGLAWLARIPGTSSPWKASLENPASLVPSTGYLVDVLPSILLFGIGISCVVAPLTNTLMGSVPMRNAGLGSAINNAISRVGQPLLAAVLFIVISGSFYGMLASRVPGLDTSSPEVRRELSPLNPPRTSDPRAVAAAHDASTDAFRLAMIVAAGLLFAGSVVNFVGIRDRRDGSEAGAADGTRGSPAS
ncbi:MAG: MFS transporter [Chloroflexi bacterium]|nr:MAG: MFS transporter [Chloroflexota bacterium]